MMMSILPIVSPVCIFETTICHKKRTEEGDGGAATHAANVNNNNTTMLYQPPRHTEQYNTTPPFDADNKQTSKAISQLLGII
jgi:hypothetical protein